MLWPVRSQVTGSGVPLVDITAERIRSSGFTPMTYQGRVLGNFMLYYDAPHRFAPQDPQGGAARSPSQPRGTPRPGRSPAGPRRFRPVGSRAPRGAGARTTSPC